MNVPAARAIVSRDHDALGQIGYRILMIRLSTTDPEFDAQLTALLSQARETTETVDRAVADILADVRARGDAAVIEYTERFDRQRLTADRLRIATAEVDAAVASVPAELAAALELAATRI